MSSDDIKICQTCGREIEWRRKWASDWDQVRYCSKACRSAKPNATDRAMEEAILDALSATPRHRVARCDPEEVTAAIEDDGRGEMRERARRAARRLAASGAVRLQQGGRDVDPSTARGPLTVVPAR